MKRIFLTLSIAGLLFSCAKDIKKGTQISVSGFLVDTVKNKNLPFAKVYLVGCINNFSGSTFCYDYLDSTTTDINGNFSINYRAEGKSVNYVLEVANDNNYGDNLFQQFPFANNSSNVRLKSQELNFLKLNLKVDFNRYDTFYIYPSHGVSKRLIGRSIDTTVLLKVLPNDKNIITYQIMAIRNDSGAIYRRLRDTLNVGLADTTNTSKRILSTYQMPLN
ncbi:MAG: hypothetical protein H0W75_09855 [Chitinophagaceae bacterium]|nr:hypothetical protein [Chitinophagaceae bacterium]